MTYLGTGPSPAGPDRTGRRLDARRNHERVIEAALQVFAEFGLQATVPQVAERAGLGKATVYRSYATKEDLVAAVALHQFQKLEGRTEAALQEPDPYRAFSDYVLDLFASLAGDRVLAEALAEGTIVSAARILDLLAQLLEAAKESGRIRRDASAMDLRVILCGAVLQLMALGRRDPVLWRRYGDMVLQALRP